MYPLRRLNTVLRVEWLYYADETSIWNEFQPLILYNDGVLWQCSLQPLNEENSAIFALSHNFRFWRMSHSQRWFYPVKCRRFSRGFFSSQTASKRDVVSTDGSLSLVILFWSLLRRICSPGTISDISCLTADYPTTQSHSNAIFLRFAKSLHVSQIDSNKDDWNVPKIYILSWAIREGFNIRRDKGHSDDSFSVEVIGDLEFL